MVNFSATVEEIEVTRAMIEAGLALDVRPDSLLEGDGFELVVPRQDSP